MWLISARWLIQGPQISSKCSVSTVLTSQYHLIIFHDLSIWFFLNSDVLPIIDITWRNCAISRKVAELGVEGGQIGMEKKIKANIATLETGMGAGIKSAAPESMPFSTYWTYLRS